MEGAGIGEKRKVIGPEAGRIIEQDKRCGALSTQDYGFIPARGDGVYLWDVEGNQYLDFTSGAGVSNLGHNHPDIVNAVIEQLMTGLWQYDANVWINEPALRLKERLIQITPGDCEKKVFLSNSGTESVEAAIKLLFASLLKNRPNRPKFIAFEGAFHGRTGYSIPLMGSKYVHRRGFPLAYTVHHFPFPNHPSKLEHIKRQMGSVFSPWEINAVVLEVIQGEGGINVLHDGAVDFLEQLRHDYDIKIVVDEVQTGFGRTGKLFACEHYGLVPDVIALAKAIASGAAPAGATVFRSSLDFPEPAMHSNTNGGNAIACRAALATIGALQAKEGRIIRNAANMGEYLMQGLREAEERFHKRVFPKRFISDIRGRGLMIGVEFANDFACPKRSLPEFRKAVKLEALRRGLILAEAGHPQKNCVLRFMPPLIIEKEEIDMAVEIFKEALNDAYKKLFF